MSFFGRMCEKIRGRRIRTVGGLWDYTMPIAKTQKNRTGARNHMHIIVYEILAQLLAMSKRFISSKKVEDTAT